MVIDFNQLIYGLLDKISKVQLSKSIRLRLTIHVSLKLKTNWVYLVPKYHEIWQESRSSKGKILKSEILAFRKPACLKIHHT